MDQNGFLEVNSDQCHTKCDLAEWSEGMLIKSIRGQSQTDEISGVELFEMFLHVGSQLYQHLHKEFRRKYL